MPLEILAKPRSDAARLALSIYSDTLDSIRADTLVDRAVSLRGDVLHVDGYACDLRAFERILVVGAGKASAAMARTIEAILGERISDGVVVTKYGHGEKTERIRVLEAAHPAPDEASVAAGRTIHDLAASAGERDLVLCLLSGGASSLMELPVNGITLDDLRTATNLLLKVGAPIEDLNAVRACLSRLKAGGLARAASPATVICLVLSDVLGNSLPVIGSGPCVDIPADPAKALSTLDRYGLSQSVPPTVRAQLELAPTTHASRLTPHASRLTPHASRLTPHHFIVGDILTALHAARDSAVRHGLRALILTGWLEGEAREVGRILGGIARDLPNTARETGYNCIILGGETTVKVHGKGKGGRSQEIAAVATQSIEGVEGVALLAGGTDGTDGPTDAAGGLAEPDTIARARELNLNLQDALRGNDAYPFLEAVGGLMKTGPTHSNVGDVVIMVFQET